MIAVDTNVLVYAHRRDSPNHRLAYRAVEDLAASGRRWCLPWPCLHEFLAVVTHPRLYRPATPMPDALGVVEDLLAAPGATTIGEIDDHAGLLGRLLTGAPGVVGAKVHDARVAAICIGHGVSELWTADRDFSYFPQLTTRNPFVAPP